MSIYYTNCQSRKSLPNREEVGGNFHENLQIGFSVKYSNATASYLCDYITYSTCRLYNVTIIISYVLCGPISLTVIAVLSYIPGMGNLLHQH